MGVEHKEEEDDLLSDKRRSGRHAQRKKYVDDVELNLSDDENLLMNLPPEAAAAAKAAREADKAAAASTEAKDDSGTVTPKDTGEDQLKAPPNSEDVSAEVTQSGPNYAYVDPTAEDTMVVQLILASRMGTRELESDEEDENAFEVPREQLSKFTGKAPPTKSQLQEAIEKAAIEADKKQNNSSNDSKDDKNDS